MTARIYLCDWLPPDFGAVGQYALLFARAHAQLGKQAVLIGLSGAASGEHVEKCGTGTLRVIRLHASRYDKGSIPERLLWT